MMDMAVATPPAICSRTFESDEIVDMLTLEFLNQADLWGPRCVISAYINDVCLVRDCEKISSGHEVLNL